MKPEIWQDEAIGGLDPWARLLFIGLITMADDDGRLRALPAAILGHVFPYDEISPRRLAAWLKSLSDVKLIAIYEHAGLPYVHIQGWAKHQKINRKADSTLPPPARNGHGKLTESVGSDT